VLAGGVWALTPVLQSRKLIAVAVDTSQVNDSGNVPKALLDEAMQPWPTVSPDAPVKITVLQFDPGTDGALVDAVVHVVYALALEGAAQL
jgi:hypothetical protein